MDNLPEHRRVYIGGLSDQINETDINNRFKTFGTIKNVEVRVDSLTGIHRGFAYMNIEIKPEQWKKCKNLFNGAKWKGSILRLEEAKPNYLERLALERKAAVEEEELLKSKTQRPRILFDGKLADDMSLVTDQNVTERRGWKRSRYGRPVAVMKLKTNTGRRILFDPLKYKNNIEKLFGSVPPKPWYRLCWEWSSRKDDEWTKKHRSEEKYDSGEYDEEDNDDQHHEVEVTKNNVGEPMDEDALEAMQREEEIRQKKNILAGILGISNAAPKRDFSVVEFDDTDNGKASKYQKTGLKPPSKEAKSRLEAGVFDSDGSDYDESGMGQNMPFGANPMGDLPDSKPAAIEGSSLKDIFGGPSIGKNRGNDSHGFRLFDASSDLSGSASVPNSLGAISKDPDSGTFRLGLFGTSESLPQSTHSIPGKPRMPTSRLFFFHLNNDALANFSPLKSLPRPVFMRTESIEKIEERWKETKSAKAQEFKRIHKSVSKKVEKLKKRKTANSGNGGH
ncbi:hypothetical protein H4219_002706 [Mycoemilia scoparia]|uniref:RRM domain-containing protein n=1 Tax=Mycoemilia scoparia TaxID=417184 RepID=A0A9W7ZWU1_9FUNG|nr:hypothetical protein H4219_002706 [Mycoemilia scoparia]